MARNNKKILILRIIFSIILLISLIFNIILLQYNFINRNMPIDINEAVSTKSIIEYSEKYLPYIITNFLTLNLLKMQNNENEIILTNIQYINTISEAI